MRRISIAVMVVSIVLLATVDLAARQRHAGNSVDLTRRNTEIQQRRVPIQMKEMRTIEGFTSRRFETGRWQGERNERIQQRRAGIDVSETQRKNIIQPPIHKFAVKERIDARENRRMATVRNFDRVQENRIAPDFRDPPVVDVREMTRPAPGEENREPISMRDINRFSFQRNHSPEPGLRQDRAGGEADASVEPHSR